MNIAPKLKATFSTKNDAGDVVQITVYFDLTGCTQTEVASWITSNRVIAFQRPLRKLSADEIRELDGTTVKASDCGKTIKSPTAQIEAHVKSGVPRKIAELMVLDPDKFNELMNKVEI